LGSLDEACEEETLVGVNAIVGSESSPFGVGSGAFVLDAIVGDERLSALPQVEFRYLARLLKQEACARA
jgi:hypothetical protein